jgi:prepilin-type N-terminal cleavage/methylation domain-containing protein
MRNRTGFTLIELLVVIAMIAILSAILRPSIMAANDRANTATCQTRLEQTSLALRQYVEDHGHMPQNLDELVRERYLLDDETIFCVRTGHEFIYHALAPDGAGDQVVATCIDPHTPLGKRPHGQGDTYVQLRLNGKTAVAGQ